MAAGLGQSSVLPSLKHDHSNAEQWKEQNQGDQAGASVIDEVKVVVTVWRSGWI